MQLIFCNKISFSEESKAKISNQGEVDRKVERKL